MGAKTCGKRYSNPRTEHLATHATFRTLVPRTSSHISWCMLDYSGANEEEIEISCYHVCLTRKPRSPAKLMELRFRIFSGRKYMDLEVTVVVALI